MPHAYSCSVPVISPLLCRGSGDTWPLTSHLVLARHNPPLPLLSLPFPFPPFSRIYFLSNSFPPLPSLLFPFPPFSYFPPVSLFTFPSLSFHSIPLFSLPTPFFPFLILPTPFLPIPSLPSPSLSFPIHSFLLSVGSYPAPRLILTYLIICTTFLRCQTHLTHLAPFQDYNTHLITGYDQRPSLGLDTKYLTQR